jgi:hypothetical protein
MRVLPWLQPQRCCLLQVQMANASVQCTQDTHRLLYIDITQQPACSHHGEPAGPARTACAWHLHGLRAALQPVWSRQPMLQRCCLAPPADAMPLHWDEDSAGLMCDIAETCRHGLSTYLEVVQSPGVRPCQTLHIASGQSSKRSSGLHVVLNSFVQSAVVTGSICCGHRIRSRWMPARVKPSAGWRPWASGVPGRRVCGRPPVPPAAHVMALTSPAARVFCNPSGR